jgi:acetyl-CoA synthetase
MIAPMPFAWECKPGSATLPFFGVHPVLLTDKGEEIHGPGRGCHLLVMRSFL